MARLLPAACRPAQRRPSYAEGALSASASAPAAYEGPTAGEIGQHQQVAATPLDEAVCAGNITEVLIDAHVTFRVAPDHVAAGSQEIRDRVLVTERFAPGSEIVKLYFGFEGGQPLTLEQIGQRFDLTRERVRQIKERALAKLRRPSIYTRIS